ncbi:MAG: hypothetical protein LQ342_007916 [Letrouitia transgressa]|nr:MAG: hypothetical protein LQ342_007916 [Letrouitia transgressa]
MRYQDDISDCSATATVFADDHECPEYDVDHDENANLTCYIPLIVGQVISVQISMKMDSPHFEADVFADGVIRNYWQSTRNKVNTRRAPKVEFTQGIYKIARSMFRSNMVVAPVEQSSNPALARENIGFIEVMISKMNAAGDTHLHGALTPDDLRKDWSGSPAAPVEGKVAPTLQMRFADGVRMQEADRGGTRVRLRRNRQGAAPWVSFKFFYREREHLRNAGITTSSSLGNFSSALRSLSTNRKRKFEDDEVDELDDIVLMRGKENIQRLKTEILELAIQTDSAKKQALAKKRKTERIANELREEYAQLMIKKAELEKQMQAAMDETEKQEASALSPSHSTSSLT